MRKGEFGETFETRADDACDEHSGSGTYTTGQPSSLSTSEHPHKKQHYEQHPTPPRLQSAMEAFSQADEDGNGKIDRHEFQKWFSRNWEHKFNTADKNKDGEVDCDEFEAWYKKEYLTGHATREIEPAVDVSHFYESRVEQEIGKLCTRQHRIERLVLLLVKQLSMAPPSPLPKEWKK